jgi:hypothetical protein
LEDHEFSLLSKSKTLQEKVQKKIADTGVVTTKALW